MSHKRLNIYLAVGGFSHRGLPRINLYHGKEVTRDALSGFLPGLLRTWGASMDGPERQGCVARATGSHLQKNPVKKDRRIKEM